jgi:hypothetical protein
MHPTLRTIRSDRVRHVVNAVAANYSENANLIAGIADRRLRAPITLTEIA